jgi:hypothetical protein
MKMGIKEFRERIGEIAEGDAVIELTKHGRVVGQYRPKRPFNPQAAMQASESIARWQQEMRAKGIEPEDLLAEMGLDPWGVPLDDRA